MIIGTPNDVTSQERRVAITPAEVASFVRNKHTVLIEKGAGVAAGFPDDEYQKKGAELCDRATVFARADVLLRVRAGALSASAQQDNAMYRPSQLVIAFMDPLAQPEGVSAMAASGVQALAIELLPRITRAQSMDALSSMATIGGYHAVITAALELPKLFPMLTTAAGTLTPARVFVLGVGVAGLQAIATAKRLGAVVEAYDIRPEVKEQVQSVGGKFIELALETQQAGDSGGYAREQSKDTLLRQQDLLAGHLAHADAVITTAAIPGKRAPILVTEAMLQRMRPGALIVDLAAESGGNCALTKAGEVVDANGVKIIGLTNVASSHAAHASQMLARNYANLLNHVLATSQSTEATQSLSLSQTDEIVAATLLCTGKAVVHPRLKV